MSRGDTAGRLRPLAASAATWKVLWGLGIIISALRGLRFAHPYARTHWLFHYGHGFVKRSLPGQLVRPLMLGKGPGEIRIVTDWLTALLAFSTACALVAFSLWALARVRPFSQRWWVVVLSTSTLVLSPFLVSLANLSGYFDQLLVLATLGAVVLVTRGRWVAAGVVCVLAVLSHEMFALFGLPVVALACWVHGGRGVRGVTCTALALLPPVLALAAVALSEHAGGGAARELASEVEATRVVPAEWSMWGAHALTHDVRTNLGDYAPRFLGWFMDPVALDRLHPTTLVMGLMALYAVVVAHTLGSWRRGFLALLTVLVVIAPWGIALLGWDWPRFFVMAQFHAHVVVLLLVAGAATSVDEPAPLVPRWPLGMLGVLAALVTVQSMTVALPRVAGGDEHERPFDFHMSSHYSCAALLFRNSTFAAGRLSPWVPATEGRAFQGQPLVGDLPARRGAPPARPFHEWIGTFEHHGSRAVGVLSSPLFEVTRDRVVFRIGGDISPGVYVRLVVDGREQHRAHAGGGERLRTVRWNVARLRGRHAVIELVDTAENGHLNAEGFCYPR